MALSSNNVKTIRQYADKFEKWAENLSYNTSPAINLWAELTLLLYPQDVQGIAFWLANITTAGQKIHKEFEEFSKLVQKVDAWRYQGIYSEDLGEFCERVNRLMKVTQDIISVLRMISDSGGSEPSGTEYITVEESNTSETHETNKASVQPTCTPDKSLPREALMAYKLHYEARLNIQQVAKRMTAELKLDKAIRPWQISRWIKQVENLHKRTRIPIRSIAPKASGATERSGRINAAAQTEVKKT
jgi:hypothetical protein